jgi:L-lactate dehydrogenase complex protein LldE
MRVALFITCFNDTLFPRTGQSVVELLERVGCEVVFPEEQTCCGQMHANSGYQLEAVPLVRRFVEVFAEEPLIATPSSSCAAMVHEQYPRLAELAGDEELAAAVREIAPRVHELSQLLLGPLGLEDVGAHYPHRVAYHPACHSLRSLRLGDGPQRLLRAVDGLELCEIEEADSCCGFGGTFAVKNADTSIAMLNDKLAAIRGSGAEVVCAADNSCLLHIGGGLSRGRLGVGTVHLAEVLASTRSAPL